MTLHLIELHEVPIYAQLKLEEALLRASDKNYCLINYGAPKAIVMGISGKANELIREEAFSSGIPVVRRFSGGGTVAVDENTLFVSYLFNNDEHTFTPFPEPIHRWSARLYQEVFPAQFQLRENDYVFGAKKFGGNAQYIRKSRWLHHSTFLWDYEQAHMNLLKLPSKRPAYRESREHGDFLCTLKDHFESVEDVIHRLKTALENKYPLETVTYDEAKNYLEQPHRASTSFVEKNTR